MITGIALPVIHSSGQLDADVVLSSHILNGEIVDVDINAAAAIASAKLNLTALAQDFLLSVTRSNDLGSVAKQWNNLFTYILNTTYIKDGLIPWADGTQDIGDVTHAWADIYVNEIKASAAGQILVYGLLGGI